MPPRSLALSALVLSAATAVAQTGPQLLTVSPPGAKHGDTVEVTVSGTNMDGVDALLFSDPAVKAEFVPEPVPVVDPKAKPPKGGAMAAPKPTGAAKFKVTVPADLRFGTFDVRAVGKGGLSNPRAFVVGSLPEAAEKEPNNDLPDAQKIEMNSTVNGTIVSATDVDYFRFPCKSGRNVVVACLASAVDSRLQADLLVAGPDGRVVATNRGYRNGDAVLDFLPAVDGDYAVRVSQFAYTSGGADHFYRLTVTTNSWIDAVYPPVHGLPGQLVPFTYYGRNFEGKDGPQFLRPDGRPFDSITLETRPPGVSPDALETDAVIAPTAAFIDAADRPPSPGLPALLQRGQVILDNGDNDTPEKAQWVEVPCDIAGRIEKKDDRDWYAFTAKKGDVRTLEVFAERIGSPIDAYMVVTTEAGKVLAEADDTPDTLSPHQFYTKSDDPARYRFTAPADGTYRVLVSSREAATQAGVRDAYVLRIAEEKPDFRLAVMPWSPGVPEGTTVPKGGTALLAVYVGRLDGFDGPVTLSAENLPAGVTCSPQVVGPGQTRGTLVLTAATDAVEWAGFVTVKGSAEVNGTNVGHAARPFAVTWPLPGNNGGVPNTPLLSRLDRGPGLALAVRGEALFTVAPASAATLTGKAGEKLDVKLKLVRAAGVTDAVPVYAVSAFAGRKDGGGGNTPTPLGTFEAGKTDLTVSVDLPSTLAAGPYTLVFRAGIVDPAAKGGGGQAKPLKAAYASAPIAVEVEAKAKKK